MFLTIKRFRFSSLLPSYPKLAARQLGHLVCVHCGEKVIKDPDLDSSSLGFSE